MPLSGPTLGRAGAFELLMLMCVAAVWGSAALPPSVADDVAPLT